MGIIVAHFAPHNAQALHCSRGDQLLNNKVSHLSKPYARASSAATCRALRPASPARALRTGYGVVRALLTCYVRHIVSERVLCCLVWILC